MKIGVTGHQERPGIDWSWVARVIREELLPIPGRVVGLSSLARGADQIFAETVLEAGGELHFIQPTATYEETFGAKHLPGFLRLRSAATTVVKLPTSFSDYDAYLAAGKYIANNSELLIAVWDGKPAKGKGGTADIVDFAKTEGKSVLHIQPVTQKVRMI